MNTTARTLMTIVSGIGMTFLYILIFQLVPSNSHDNSISEVSTLAQLPGISHSAPFIENRVSLYDDYSNDFYLGMKNNNYKGFVYAK